MRHACLIDEGKQALADCLEGLPIRALSVWSLGAACRQRSHSILPGRTFSCLSAARGSSRRSIRIRGPCGGV
jgi:hypothetical protein